jgi:mono/diheme cytochrome c family protein
MTKRLLRIATIAIGAAALTGAADGSWLRRVPANDHARVNPLTDAASAAEAGSHLYANSCAKCHGEHGQGKGSRPAVVSERVAGASDGDLAWLLKNGNTWKGMPSWSVLPDSERWQLVAYLRSINTPAKTQATVQHGLEQGETK